MCCGAQIQSRNTLPHQIFSTVPRRAFRKATSITNNVEEREQLFLSSRLSNVIILRTQWNPWKFTKQEIESQDDGNCYLDRTLSTNEINNFKALISKLNIETEEKNKLSKQLENGKKYLVTVVLQIFGSNFDEELLVKFVNDRRPHILPHEWKVAKYCSLDKYAGRKDAIHIPAFDSLFLREGYQVYPQAIEDSLSPPMLDLIIQEADNTWHPTHYLVGAAILKASEQKIATLVLEYLEDMFPGRSYAQEKLADLTVDMLQRTKKSDENGLADEEHYRFSELIEDVKQINIDDGEKVFRKSIILAEYYNHWTVYQHLARYLIYRNSPNYDGAIESIDKAISKDPTNSYFRNTKGVIYLKMLDVQTRLSKPSTKEVKPAIGTAMRAWEQFEKGLDISKNQNLHTLVGAIQTCVVLLEHLKKLELFSASSDQLYAYCCGENIKDLNTEWNVEEQKFVRNTLENVLDLFRKFTEFKFFQQNSKAKLQSELDSLERVHKCREKIYTIFGKDVSKRVKTVFQNSPINITSYRLDEILSQKNETFLGRWTYIETKQLKEMFEILRSKISTKVPHWIMTDFEMVILARCGIELGEIDAVASWVQEWCKGNRKSMHAIFYSYMLFFPFPKNAKSISPDDIKGQIIRCTKGMQGFSMKGDRSFFFAGLDGKLVPVRKIASNDKQLKKDAFWKTPLLAQHLVRLRGTKIDEGIIDYEGISVRFWPHLYPRKGNDVLEFYLGFTYTGPFAYDPQIVDNNNNVEHNS